MPDNGQFSRHSTDTVERASYLRLGLINRVRRGILARDGGARKTLAYQRSLYKKCIVSAVTVGCVVVAKTMRTVNEARAESLNDAKQGTSRDEWTYRSWRFILITELLKLRQLLVASRVIVTHGAWLVGARVDAGAVRKSSGLVMEAEVWVWMMLGVTHVAAR